jgi:hypothetical protein
LLRLESDNRVLNGVAWGVANLKSGQCVGVWKEIKGNTKKRPLDDSNCKSVVSRLFRDKKDWLWESSLIIKYDGKKFGSCDEDQNECLITIAP